MRVSAVLRSTMAVRGVRFDWRLSLLPDCHCASPPAFNAASDIVERHNGLLHLLARSDGDAHAAIAAWIAGAVAHQHARRAHEAHKLRVLCADLDQDKVRAAGPAAHSGCIERGFESARALQAPRSHTSRDRPYLRAPAAGRPAPASSRCRAKARGEPSASVRPGRPAGRGASRQVRRPLRRCARRSDWA